MATYYGYLRRMGAFGSRNTANPASPSFVAAPPPPAKPAPFVMGQGMDPGVRTASPSPGGGFRQALSQAARAIVAAGAAGPSPGGLYRQAVARTTQARAMALAGAARIPPSYSGNPFVLARPGDGFGSGGAGPSPGGQYRQAIEQGARALLGALTAPGGAAPGGQYRQALSRSARAVTAAKAAANAARSLLFTGYDLPSRRDATTDAAAASLADRLGFGRYVSGRERIGWPPRGRGGAANAGSMMDAASRILAARSRGRNAAAAGAARNLLMLGGSARRAVRSFADATEPLGRRAAIASGGRLRSLSRPHHTPQPVARLSAHKIPQQHIARVWRRFPCHDRDARAPGHQERVRSAHAV